MDEQAFWRILRDEPDNEEVRLAYLNWLEEIGDNRAEYVRMMRERLKLQRELEEIDARLRAHVPRIGDAWLDLAFPLRIRSPIVGRCYTNPAPNAPSFVALGDYVTPDRVVCVVEAMSILNEITAGVHGVVTEITVANGDLVEYNQVLFRIGHPPDPLDYW